LARALGPIALVPGQRQLIDIFRVSSIATGTWDHWLFRARPVLPLSVRDGTTAEVFGGQLEIRIGPGGAVLGYLSRWRPLLDDYEDVPQTSMPPTDTNGARRKVAYILDGEAALQHYLAPYFLSADGDDLEVSSACALSLVVRVARHSVEDPTKYVAVVEGGSGDYLFDWGVVPLADLSEAGFRELGSGDRIRIDSDGSRVTLGLVTVPAGAHLLLVNVIDQQTGAFRHHSEQVYVAPGQPLLA
jgi:hypothetical protein